MAGKTYHKTCSELSPMSIQMLDLNLTREMPRLAKPHPTINPWVLSPFFLIGFGFKAFLEGPKVPPKVHGCNSIFFFASLKEPHWLAHHQCFCEHWALPNRSTFSDAGHKIDKMCSPIIHLLSLCTWELDFGQTP
jgi:hypothetical protein